MKFIKYLFITIVALVALVAIAGIIKFNILGDEIMITEEENITLSGEVVFGHEVRSFRPDGTEEELWLMGEVDLVRAMFSEEEIQNYTPKNMTLVGKRVVNPDGEFAQDYEGGFSVIEVR